MIRYNAKTFKGEIAIGFKHNLPENKFIQKANGETKLVSTQGFTECTVEVPHANGETMDKFHGFCYLHPKDKYCKEMGRVGSLARAIDAGEFSNAQAREIMVAYYMRSHIPLSQKMDYHQ